MLTDIFADRYSGVELWTSFGEAERRLLVQSFRILSEQICPWFENGKATDRSKAFWDDIHSRISMELGLTELFPSKFWYTTTWGGKQNQVVGSRTTDEVCKNWMLQNFTEPGSADRFIKERLSLIELGFRKRETEIGAINSKLPKQLLMAQIHDANRKKKQSLGASKGGMRVPGDKETSVKAINNHINAQFGEFVIELNARFRQAGCNLNYHNGFIQISNDKLTEQQIETPFWALISDSKWENVNVDMAEAVDRRDTGGRDPAFYAVRALESTIKIISGDIGSTTGREIGAGNFIDRLASGKFKFLDRWEADALKTFFKDVRNLLGHGPGSEPMPALSKQQTDWAIETSMIWIKSLINRMEK